MKPTETLAKTLAPDGAELVLTRRDGIFRLSLDGQELMASRQNDSERELAKLACAALVGRPRPRVLVGGLGFGYTLRAALDHLPQSATVVVCEVFALLFEAHEKWLGDLAKRPLEDPRVVRKLADVQTLLGGREKWDAILLDVDNGPWAFTLASNRDLYSERGLDRLRASLNPGGIIAVWSAEPSPEFKKRLERARFRVRTVRAPARAGGNKRHTIFLAQEGEAMGIAVARNRPRSANR